MLKPKVGDLVRLKPLIVMGGDDSCGVRVSLATPEQQNETRWAYVQPALIEEILPRPFVVGDRVRTIARPHIVLRTGVVIAVEGKEAWVRWEGGQSAVVLIEGNIERIDDLA